MSLGIFYSDMFVHALDLEVNKTSEKKQGKNIRKYDKQKFHFGGCIEYVCQIFKKMITSCFVS